ncbi:YdbL family protein [uncultured Nitrosomonas sp.]|uniref:YdbL family protein n=1 Tax=uncultured Nitrosomonas sp. TaxID=156424 RepID=UPI0025E184BA|nr:YdbL family protein [uncultured Nitrosomonas sp.]
MLRISNRIFKKPSSKISGIIFLVSALYAIPAWADNLENLRALGAVGESSTGYVIAREPSAQAEADAINAKRKAIYQEKAAAQGIDANQVGKVYAEEIIQKVPSGTWIQISGQWRQK